MVKFNLLNQLQKNTRHCERAKQFPDARNKPEIVTSTLNNKHPLLPGLITLLSLMLLMFYQNIFAAEKFTITVKQTSIQLGKPVWLDLQTDQSSPSLDSIDFTPVADHFEVVIDKNEIQKNKQGQQWRIRLYPRQTGQQSIAGLRFQAQVAQPITLQVDNPIDSKTGQPFTITQSLDHAQPWLRQQVLFRYEVTGPVAQLVLEPQPSTANNILIIPLSTQTQQQADHYRHSTGWALYPRQTGQQTIRLPALHYTRDGVITHHFYPPPVKLEVKPLPAYLPGSLPVGRLKLAINDVPGLLLKNSLADVQLQFSGEGIPLQWLPDIRYFLKSNAHLTIYPSEPRSAQSTDNGIQSSYRYHLPIRPTAQGRLILPTTSLHYFDPYTGRLAHLTMPEHSLPSLSLLTLTILSLLALGFSTWIVRESFHQLHPRWRSLRTYHTALQKLTTLHTAPEFKQLITELAAADGYSANLSLCQWQIILPNNVAGLATRIRQQLEPALYRGEDCGINELRIKLREFCIKRWRVLRWVKIA